MLYVRGPSAEVGHAVALYNHLLKATREIAAPTRALAAREKVKETDGIGSLFGAPTAKSAPSRRERSHTAPVPGHRPPPSPAASSRAARVGPSAEFRRWSPRAVAAARGQEARAAGGKRRGPPAGAVVGRGSNSSYFGPPPRVKNESFTLAFQGQKRQHLPLLFSRSESSRGSGNLARGF